MEMIAYLGGFLAFFFFWGGGGVRGGGPVSHLTPNIYTELIHLISSQHISCANWVCRY